MNKLFQTVCGIDYSIRSPSLCVIPYNELDDAVIPIEQCHLYYLTNTKSHIIETDFIHGDSFNGWKTDEERYASIADWVLQCLKKHDCVSVGLEGYSFGSKGSALFQIAENTGLLKYFLSTSSIAVNTFSPSSIKKFATNNGRSDKNQMYHAFCVDNPQTKLMSMFGRNETDKVKSPVSDLVDSYYIALSQRVEACRDNTIYLSPQQKEKE